MHSNAHPLTLHIQAVRGWQESIGRHDGDHRMMVIKQRFHKIMWPITRRATLRIGLSAALSGLFPDWETAAQAPVSDELHARFLRWSRTATGFPDLPADAARTCMELLLQSGISPEKLWNSRTGLLRRHPDREASARSLVHRRLQDGCIAGRTKLSDDLDVAGRRIEPAAGHLRRRSQRLGFRAFQYLKSDFWPSTAMW